MFYNFYMNFQTEFKFYQYNHDNRVSFWCQWNFNTFHSKFLINITSTVILMLYYPVNTQNLNDKTNKNKWRKLNIKLRTTWGKCKIQTYVKHQALFQACQAEIKITLRTYKIFLRFIHVRILSQAIVQWHTEESLRYDFIV